MVKYKAKKKENIKNKNYKSNFLSNSYFLLFLIVFAAFIVFSYGLNCGFVNWDDPAMVTDNTQVQSQLSLKSIQDIFAVKSMSNEYQPLTTIVYHVIYNTFNLDSFYFHLFNIVFHLINIILVFIFIRLLFVKDTIALITAAFFAIHPLNVEVVVWVSAANYILFSFFSLLSLIFYIKYIKEKNKIKYFIWTFVVFTMALLSKSTAFIVPLLFLLIDYLSSRKISINVVLEKTPFFLLSLGTALIAIFLKKQILSANAQIIYTFYDRILFIFYSFGLYIIKLIFPFDLKIVYAYPVKVNNILPLELYFIPFLIILGIVLLLVYFKKNRKLIIFSMLFFLFNIIMVIHIIPYYHISIIAERYVYLASLGVFVLLAHYLVRFKEENKHVLKNSIYGVVIIYFVVFLVNSTQRVRVWESDKTLFADLIRKNPEEPVSYNNLGNKEDMVGNHEKAIEYYNKALSINDNYAEAFYNRGLSYYKLKDFDKAHTDFDKAIQINPNFSKAFNNRGTAKYFLNDPKGACNDWRKALALGYIEAKENIQEFCKE